MYIMKLLLISVLLQSITFASTFIDSDFDGVDDRHDKCPSTPFSELVDHEGCSVKSVPMAKELRKLSFVIGTNYSNYKSKNGNKTKTLSESLEIDYEIKKIKLMLYISRFSSKNSLYSEYDESSFSDTRLSMRYTLDQKMPNLQLSLGGGIAIPNYKGNMHNNGFDFFYSLNANYYIEKTSLFASYTFTKIGDKDLDYLSYQNTHALSIGAGYSFTRDLYSSLSYYVSDSIIKSSDKIKNISCFTYYNINQELYSTFSISHGLEKDSTNNSFGMQLGYRM